MKKLSAICVIAFVVITGVFARSFLQGKLPIPADTIVGLYYPFHDNFAQQYPRGVPYKNFLITDPVRQTFPWRQMSISLERTLHLPLWNPYEMAGYPLLANLQSAAFYPLNLLLFVLPFSFGWSILLILQPLLAGIFLYIYLRNKNLGQLPAFLGGVTFTFSGFMTTWFEWGTVGQTALWLPLILLSIDKALLLKERKFSVFNFQFSIWHLVFIFSLVCAFLAGHLQTFVYLFVISFVYLIFQWITSSKDKKVLFLFFICYVLFALITSLQWLPFLQFLNLSARNVDLLGNWQSLGWFIPWQHVVQFLAPDFFGNPTTLNYWGVWNYGELTGYISVLPLILGLFAILSVRKKEIAFFAGVVLVSLLFAFPTPLAKLPYILSIPFLSTAQPTRLLFLVDFSLAVLAAYGLEKLLGKKDKKIFVILALLCLLYGLLWLVVLGKLPAFHITAQNLLVAKHNLYLPTLLFVLSAFSLIALYVLPKKLTAFIAVLIILATLFDLLRFSNKFNPFTDPAYLFPNTKVLTYLQKHTDNARIMATDSRILPPNFSVMYSLQSVDGYDPLYPLRFGEYITAMERNKPDITPPFGFNRIITPQNPASRLIDLLGVKYILSLTSLSSPKLKKVYSFGQTTVYQNTQVLPRVFLVQSVRRENAKKAVLRDLLNPQISLRNTAIVEGYTGTQTAFATGSAAITSYTPDTVRIQTKSTGTAFLVLTDTYYPSWQAAICDNRGANCVSGAIYQTDYLFRGIIVPKGSHIIVFSDKLF